MLSDQHHKRKTEGCGRKSEKSGRTIEVVGITHRFKEREFTDCGEMQAGELRECGGVEGLGRVVIRWRMDEDVEEEASLSQAVPSSDHWLKTTAGPDYSGYMRAHVHMHITLLSSLPQTHTHLPCSFTSTPNHTVSFSNTYPYTQVKPKHILLGNQQDGESCLEFSESIFRIITNTRLDLKNLVFAESLLSRCGQQLERVCLRKQEGVLLS